MKHNIYKIGLALSALIALGWVSTRTSTSDLWSTPVNLGPVVNSAAVESRPALSFRGTELYFNSNRPGGFRSQDLYVSRRTRLRDLEIHPIDALNSPFRENEATFSADGETVYFTCSGRPGSPGLRDICVSHLTGDFEDAQWSEPELVPFPISTPFSEQEPMLTLDGRHLYFSSNRPGGLGRVDVYVSEMGPDGEWQTPVNLGAPINTPDLDHCFYFADMETEDEAYMASDRTGTLGGNDIWHTRKVDGVWTEPENLGPNINSSGNEHMAMVGPDGRLWVTAGPTPRPGGLGGEDQWFSKRDANGDWTPLVNLGEPMNTSSDDRCGAWAKDGKFFVFSSSFPEDPADPPGSGNQHIYFVNFDDLLESLGLSGIAADGRMRDDRPQKGRSPLHHESSNLGLTAKDLRR